MAAPISRRTAILGAAALTAPAILRPHSAFAATTNTGGVRVCAIRFDAWYGGEAGAPGASAGTSDWYASHDLDAPQYQARAPFFAKRLSPALMSINGQQADMDAELLYAANAGLKWYAWAWYGPTSNYRKAWNYYQASPNKNLVNWCVLIGLSSLAANFPATSEYLSFFQQGNYEKYGTRPLIVVFYDNSSQSAAATAISNLRTACSNAGVGNPYILLQANSAALAASTMTAIGADAIGCYATAPATSGPISYSAMDTFVQNFNAALIATGSPVIPLMMSGWDRRPRIERPPPFDIEWKPFGAMSSYVAPGTPAQIASHFTSVIAQVTNNASACPANKALAYSWNEFDEGGGGLCPLWTAAGPNSAILAALTGVL
jgi:hypothetical protein